MSKQRAEAQLRIAELLGDLNIGSFKFYRDVVVADLVTDGGIKPVYRAELPCDQFPQELKDKLREAELGIIEFLAEGLDRQLLSEIGHLSEVRRLLSALTPEEFDRREIETWLYEVKKGVDERESGESEEN